MSKESVIRFCNDVIQNNKKTTDSKNCYNFDAHSFIKYLLIWLCSLLIFFFIPVFISASKPDIKTFLSALYETISATDTLVLLTSSFFTCLAEMFWNPNKDFQKVKEITITVFLIKIIVMFVLFTIIGVSETIGIKNILTQNILHINIIFLISTVIFSIFSFVLLSFSTDNNSQNSF